MPDDAPKAITKSREGQPLCPNCLEKVDPLADFCERCGAPLTMFAAVDPIKSIRSRGRAWRQAA